MVLASGVTAFDWPAAQTIVYDAVGRERLLNAVSLNSIANNLASIVGPSIAGVLIAVSGVDTVLYCLGGAYQQKDVPLKSWNCGTSFCW